MTGRSEPPKREPTGERMSSLGRELVLVLLVKLAVLVLLWLAFFRTPAPADPERLFPQAQQPSQESRR